MPDHRSNNDLWLFKVTHINANHPFQEFELHYAYVFVLKTLQLP